ncbi:hypothetical protein [Sphingomonas sp.]|uniref:hypothetical protein n=1 Tax=Sphingomonas sp. TaxID=28214 RepID=UPI003B00D4D4
MLIAAAAAALTLPFAPPLDHPLRYELVETTPSPGGGEWRFRLVEEARFTREGAGFALALRARRVAANGHSEGSATLDAAVRPTIGVPLVLRVSAGGVATDVIEGGAK